MNQDADARRSTQKLILVLRAARVVNAEMPAQTLEAFLTIAAYPDLTLRELQDKLGLSSAATTRNVAALASNRGKGVAGLGLVDTREGMADRRVKHVALTSKGIRFLQTLVAPIQEKK